MSRFFPVILVLFVLFSGCVVFTDVDGSRLSLSRDSIGWFVESFSVSSSDVVLLKALVKGSIYESGEMVSVFGTCLDGDDNVVPGVVAFMSAWYPNGSLFFSNVSMFEIQDSYFLYTGPMEVVEGTYLTELRCFDSSSNISALAFGEWQNPFWVSRLAVIQNSTDLLVDQVQNITVVIGDLSVNISDGFEITWDLLGGINATIVSNHENISNQLYWVAEVANGSVDRNDSYIVQLIQNITSMLTPVNLSGNPVTWTESPGSLVYWSTWNIRVDTFDIPTGKRVFFPDVACTISTSLTPGPSFMTPVGNHFVYSEFINFGGDFVWVVNCYYQ